MYYCTTFVGYCRFSHAAKVINFIDSRNHNSAKSLKILLFKAFSTLFWQKNRKFLQKKVQHIEKVITFAGVKVVI